MDSLVQKLLKAATKPVEPLPLTVAKTHQRC
jgi:hypothetical protein